MSKKKYVVEEIMRAVEDIPAGLLPHLLASKLLIEPARKATPVLETINDNYDLIGHDGTVIKIPKLTAISASDVPMDDFEASPSFTISDKVISELEITVSKLQYVAWKFSKRFLEDFPSIDWLSVFTRNAREALRAKLASDVRDALYTANTEFVSCEDLNFDAVLEAKTKLENSGVISGEETPWLIVSPDAKKTLLQDTKFIQTPRFTTSDVSKIVDGEFGLYCGCRILISPYLDNTGLAYIIPQGTAKEPVILAVWKRKYEAESKYDAEVEEHFHKITARYVISLVRPLYVCKIFITKTP